MLGQGQFGLVNKGVNRETGEKVAIKKIAKKAMTVLEAFQQRREIEVLKMCQHPNIVQQLNVVEDSANYYIVLEYMKGPDLYDYLQQRNFNLGEERIREISLQLLRGIQYLHNYGIIHRDLKLENVIMSDNSDRAVPKIVDF